MTADATMNGVRAAAIVGHASAGAFVALVACSGASTTIIDQPGDGGGPGSDGGVHGGADATGGGSDAPAGGDDASDTGTVLHDAQAHDTGAACAPSPPDGAACNSMTPPPPAITIQCNAAEQVPAPTGGPISDGTYVMTGSTYYAGGGACQTPEVDGVTWLVCGTSWQIAQTTTLSGQTPQTLVANATVIQAGSDLNITLTCGVPNQQPLTFGYDATSTTLRLHINGASPAGRIDTFMRQ